MTPMIVRVCGGVSVALAPATERQSLADRFAGSAIREESIGERLRDDRHLLGACAVIAAEIAAAQKRNAHRVQVTSPTRVTWTRTGIGAPFASACSDTVVPRSRGIQR